MATRSSCSTCTLISRRRRREQGRTGSSRACGRGWCSTATWWVSKHRFFIILMLVNIFLIESGSYIFLIPHAHLYLHSASRGCKAGMKHARPEHHTNRASQQQSITATEQHSKSAAQQESRARGQTWPLSAQPELM
jgi:hypothetical protein